MSNINQNAGNNGLQIGSAGNIHISGRGVGWWGCVTFTAVASVIGIAAVIAAIAFAGSDFMSKTAPLAMTAAAQPPVDPSQQYAWQAGPQTLPANTECPYLDGMVWLDESDVWYGPVVLDGITYSVAYDQYNIYVYSSAEGLSYLPDPAAYQGRNQWLPLGPFLFCVDSYNYVYAY